MGTLLIPHSFHGPLKNDKFLQMPENLPIQNPTPANITKLRKITTWYFHHAKLSMLFFITLIVFTL